jgi:hypothetical protein
LKLTGLHPVEWRARIARKEYYETPPEIHKKLVQYATELCLQPEFLAAKNDARYLTLMWLTDLERIDPIPFSQEGQQSWFDDWPAPKKSGVQVALFN